MDTTRKRIIIGIALLVHGFADLIIRGFSLYGVGSAVFMALCARIIINKTFD